MTKMFYSDPIKNTLLIENYTVNAMIKNKVKNKGQKNKMWWLGKDCVKKPGYDHQPACGAQRF